MKVMSLGLSVLLALNSSNSLAQSFMDDDPFAELDSAIDSINNEGSKAEQSEFQAWKKDYLAEYQAFREEHFNKLDDIRDNLIGLWGEAEVPSQSQAVEYSSDKKTKTVIDFEKNEVRVSVLHHKNEEVSKAAIASALTKQSQQNNELNQLVGKKVDSTTVNQMINKAKKTETGTAIASSERAVLAKEIKLIEEQSIAQKSQVEKLHDIANVDKVNNAITPQAEKQAEKEISAQKAQIDKEKQQRIAELKAKVAKLQQNKKQKAALEEKKITTYTMPLANKKELNKAKPYIADVQKESKRWGLSPSLMLAIMQTESYFNPKAQSHIPAFGLMQIVPRTAGIDVNRFLYKKDAALEKEYLFKAEQNIETGVAYMHILNSRYLKKVTNPTSRMYCMIAAYNTGSGNVAKTFNADGSRNINKAAPIINALTPDQVYQHLINHLPYDETRHYVQRVVKRKSIYAPVESM